jgi:hypothetical protein
MLYLDSHLKYKEAREIVKNWSDGDLEDFLINYEDDINPVKRILIKLGFVSYYAVDAVEDELLNRH